MAANSSCNVLYRFVSLPPQIPNSKTLMRFFVLPILLIQLAQMIIRRHIVPMINYQAD